LAATDNPNAPLVASPQAKDKIMLTVNRKALTDTLAQICAVVPTTTKKPILRCVALRHCGETLTLTGGNGSLQVSIDLPASGAIDDCIVSNPKQWLKALKQCESESVSLCIDDDTLATHDAHDCYKQPLIVGECYPHMPTIAHDGMVTHDAASMLQAINSTKHAVDNDRQSIELSALCVNATSVTATNGKILASHDMSGSGDADKLIPRAAIKPLLAAIKSSDAGCVVSIGNDGIAVNSTRIAYTRIDGAYPNWRNAIPQNNQGMIDIDKASIVRAIKKLGAYTTSTTKGSILNIQDKTLSNLNKTSGSASIAVELSHNLQDAQRVGLNLGYLSDLIATVEGATLTLEYNGIGRGLVVRNANNTHLIMPITLPS
jgi:DNA polymerase III sliding clamp (beta) subunit (PCNA family)